MNNIDHKDHGLNDSQWMLIFQNLAMNPPSGFFIRAVKLTDGSSMPNALYGPEEGDPAITENDVVYLRRRGRMANSRMLRNPDTKKRPCSTIQVIGVAHEDGTTTIYTAYAGSVAALREPWDPDIKDDKERNEAAKFWATHALTQEGFEFLPPVDFEQKVIDQHPAYWGDAKKYFPDMYYKAMKEAVDNELRVERGEEKIPSHSGKQLTVMLGER